VAELEQDKYRHNTAALELVSANDHANAFSNDNFIHSEVRGELQLDNDVVDTRVDTGNNDNVSTAAIASDNVRFIQTQVLVLALLDRAIFSHPNVKVHNQVEFDYRPLNDL
jgi:hypothetical protein